MYVCMYVRTNGGSSTLRQSGHPPTYLPTYLPPGLVGERASRGHGMHDDDDDDEGSTSMLSPPLSSSPPPASSSSSGHQGMYVCMYVCIYVGMYVCMYVCIYVCTPPKSSLHPIIILPAYLPTYLPTVGHHHHHHSSSSIASIAHTTVTVTLSDITLRKGKLPISSKLMIRLNGQVGR